MKTKNAVITGQAREALRGKWRRAIGVCLLYFLITMAAQMISMGFIVSLLVSGPLTLGLVIFSLAISRNTESKLEQLFEGFKKFSVSLVAYLLVMLFSLLWTLLLIVPGIIASLSYAMTFFIIADDNSITAREAIRKSKKMMAGFKWKLFCLQFRFLGWAILSIFTLGIGFLWLMPYIQISLAKFYEDIKNGEGSVVAKEDTAHLELKETNI